MLNSHKVEYLLIGGYAVNYYGYSRATAAMDIWVAVHPRNAERLVAALKAFGFDVPALTPELFLQEDRVTRMGVPPFRADLLNTISGVDFDECYAERVQDTLGDVSVNIIKLGHLKANKKASGRHKDLDDLEHLP